MNFTAAIQEAGGGGHSVEVPVEVAAGFSSKRPAVRALVDGVEYRSRLMVYGGKSYLGLRNALLAQIGADIGDTVRIELTEDFEPRVIEEPPELVDALAAEVAARQAYDALSFTHRREYAVWVAEAKRADTRTSRAARAVEMLLEGKTR